MYVLILNVEELSKFMQVVDVLLLTLLLIVGFSKHDMKNLYHNYLVSCFKQFLIIGILFTIILIILRYITKWW
jgi:hypothetical protein